MSTRVPEPAWETLEEFEEEIDQALVTIAEAVEILRGLFGDDEEELACV